MPNSPTLTDIYVRNLSQHWHDLKYILHNNVLYEWSDIMSKQVIVGQTFAKNGPKIADVQP